MTALETVFTVDSAPRLRIGVEAGEVLTEHLGGVGDRVGGHELQLHLLAVLVAALWLLPLGLG